MARGPTRLYSIPEAARMWGVPRSSLYEEARAGRLDARTRRGCSRGMKVTADEMERWVREERQGRRREEAR